MFNKSPSKNIRTPRKLPLLFPFRNAQMLAGNSRGSLAVLEIQEQGENSPQSQGLPTHTVVQQALSKLGKSKAVGLIGEEKKSDVSTFSEGSKSCWVHCHKHEEKALQLVRLLM